MKTASSRRSILIAFRLHTYGCQRPRFLYYRSTCVKFGEGEPKTCRTRFDGGRRCPIVSTNESFDRAREGDSSALAVGHCGVSRVATERFRSRTAGVSAPESEIRSPRLPFGIGSGARARAEFGSLSLRAGSWREPRRLAPTVRATRPLPRRERPACASFPRVRDSRRRPPDCR